MNRHSIRTESSREKAFTLSEVTISVGIVSAILLPILGLLATGTRLSTESQDQAAAAVIASKIAESFHSESAVNGRSRLLLSKDEEITIQTSGGQAIYLSFTSTGDFLRVINEGEYESGLRGDDAALYLARTHLEPPPIRKGSIARHYPLLSLKIEVEQPAMAAMATRSSLVFTSRVGSP